MKKLVLFAVSVLSTVTVLLACADVSADSVPPVLSANWSASTKKTMRSFGSDQELTAYLKEIAKKQSRRARGNAGAVSETVTVAGAPAALDESVTLAREESITNVQHAGVDEGGIVKLHGDHLVVLRRGRLFTVKLGDGSLKPVSAVDAFGPDINPESTWYDEMLVSEDTIVVIGYSYERGGTEVGLFNINERGKISYRSTYHLRSNDYYSSRNYASRLIGNKLIFYTPLYLDPGAQDPFASFPAVRKWHKRAKAGEFHRVVSSTRVYRPEQELTPSYGLSLHTVTVCDLANSGFACNASAVLGPPGRVFYVSPESVYVWVTDWVQSGDKQREQSMLYRMPLDASAPSALIVSGSPIDQFSFNESDDQHLNVLVRANSSGDGMWAAEVASGDVALMRVPISSFSDGSEPVPSSRYRELPEPQGYTFQNRFVSDYVLYGTGNGWGSNQKTNGADLFAVRWAGGDVSTLRLKHGIDRIEQMGRDAVIVGTEGDDLHFTAIRLAASPDVAGGYVRKGASQGELRSHGFFYKADGPDSGTLGLPISTPSRPGYRHLFESSAAILFLRNESLKFEEVGELGSRPERATDDGCRASCVDWYGNARPLFVRGRVLALLGYEVVEGFRDNGRIHEMRRINYAPRGFEITRR